MHGEMRNANTILIRFTSKDETTWEHLGIAMKDILKWSLDKQGIFFMGQNLESIRSKHFLVC
jgi:hypothetical protein